jgi:hypothetical protein
VQGESLKTFTEWPTKLLELRMGHLAVMKAEMFVELDQRFLEREINHIAFELACRTVADLHKA